MAKKKLYKILSPDGFPISIEKTEYGKREVKKALIEFADRYKKQGFYSSARYGPIEVEDIPYLCDVIPI